MRALRVSTILLGAAILCYGAYGLFTEPQIRNYLSVGEWLAGGVLVHDLVLAPIVFGLAWFAARRTSPKVRASLAAALMILGTLALVAAPLVLHGRVATR